MCGEVCCVVFFYNNGHCYYNIEYIMSDSELSMPSESDDFFPDQERILGENYQICKKLGSGAYATVWECRTVNSNGAVPDNMSITDPQKVAVKVFKENSRHQSDTSRLEYELLHDLDHPNIVRLIRRFKHYTTDPSAKKYYCVVYELCHTDLYSYMKSNGFKPLNLAIVKSFIYQVCSGLAAIHERGIQHLDLKPENILIDRECSLFKLADFGTAEWTCSSKVGLVGTREYRAPEIILGLNHSPACDIWAVGCIIFELLTGHTLFDPRNYSLHNIARDEDHLVQMQELMGPFPTWMMRGSRRRRFLTRYGQPKHIEYIYAKPLNHLLQDFNIYDSGLLDLLNRMLELDPMRRATAAECMALVHIEKN